MPTRTERDQWWSYERPPTYDVLATKVEVPLRDGVALACELRRPARDGAAVEGRFPSLVVEFSPYVVLHDFYAAEADFFVQRGYNAVVGTLRGIGGSGGSWDNGSFVQCGRDAHDLIEWLAAQPCSDGRVGMFGESFGGQTSYSAAIEAPEHLVAIAPMQSPSSLYHDVIFPGGIKTTERGAIDMWPDVAVLTSEGVIDADAEYAVNRSHPTFDGFWRDRAFIDRLDSVTVPVLAIGGWDDGFFRSGTIRNIEALPERTWAIYGPWPHFFPVALADTSFMQSAGPSAEVEQLPPGVLLAWFDHWLAGLPDVPIPPAPTFTSYEGPVGTGAGWCELDGWAGPGASGIELPLRADGDLSFTQPATSDDAVDAVSFTSEPLDADLVLVGHPSLAAPFTLDAADAHLYLELVEVAPDGSTTWINDGFLAASNRRSHTEPAPAPVGELLDLRLPIRPHHHRFVAGNRVRVQVSGGPPSKVTAAPQPVTTTFATGDAVLHVPGFRPG